MVEAVVWMKGYNFEEERKVYGAQVKIELKKILMLEGMKWAVMYGYQETVNVSVYREVEGVIRDAMHIKAYSSEKKDIDEIINEVIKHIPTNFISVFKH